MDGIYIGYVFAVLMSILMFIPLLYGLRTKGIDDTVERIFFYLILANLSWSLLQFAQITVGNTFHLIIIETLVLFATWGSIYGSFIFSLVYTDRSDWLTKEVIGVSIVPIFAYIIFTMYTYFTAEPTVQEYPFTYLIYEMVFVDWIALAYTFTLFIMAFAFFIDFYRKNNSEAAKGIPILIFGLSVPVSLGFLSYFDVLIAPQFNHGPLGFPVFAIAITVAIYQFDMLNIKPVALDNFIQDFPHPLFILDPEKRIMDYNEVANDFVCTDIEKSVNFEVAVPFVSSTIDNLFVGEGVNGEIVSEEVAGSKQYFMVSSSVVYDENSEFLGWVVYIKDITEREEQKKELERQNKQLERFADGIVHDIRNPLAIATQYSELYFESLIDEDEAAVPPEKAYDVIRNAHTRLDEIIDNIRWLSTFGQTIEETEAVQVSSLVRDVWRSLEHSEAAELEVSMDGTIKAEPKRLKSVFDNIFKNSLRYAGEDCHITVEVTDNGDINISDDGPGIPEDEQENLFEYGYTTSDEGTGFGLSLVKTVVDAHGWNIEVDGSYTDGARFKISGVTVIETEKS